MAFKWDKKQIRLGVAGFFVVFLISLVSLKPYLPAAVYHNFATIYDYKFFQNRTVRKAEKPESLPVSSFKIVDPPDQTLGLLGSLKTTALLVLQEGAIVYEKYFDDGGQDVLSGSFSMAKSIVALLTGFALQEGRIRSLDEAVSNYIPEWQGLDEGKITLRQLLQMTSGLNWNETYMNPLSITTEAYYGTNLHFTTLRQRLERPPGTMFSYQSGTTQLLGLIVSRAVNKNLADYASEKLWRPLGAESDALWSIDREGGMEKAYCCFNARARDFARIGEFVRNLGKWNGVQLLSENYVREMVHPHGVLDKDGHPTDYYGYQWWIYKSALGEVPYARGILGQYIIVIPARNRVIVRLGKKTADRIDHHPIEVRELVDWGIRN